MTVDSYSMDPTSTLARISSTTRRQYAIEASSGSPPVWFQRRCSKNRHVRNSLSVVFARALAIAAAASNDPQYSYPSNVRANRIISPQSEAGGGTSATVRSLLEIRRVGSTVGLLRNQLRIPRMRRVRERMALGGDVRQRINTESSILTRLAAMFPETYRPLPVRALLILPGRTVLQFAARLAE